MTYKKIMIMQRPVASHLPVPIINNSVRTIGSIYKEGAPLRGMSKEDENKYLPLLLGVDINDPTYHKQARDFWLNVRIPVPGDGKELNVSVKEDGAPFNIKDWIHYQFVKRHDLVADSRDELKTHQLFFIYDYEKEKMKENNNYKVKRKAYIELDKLEKNKEKMDMIYSIISSNDGSKLSEIDLSNELNSYVEEAPEKFYRIATDKKLETKAFIAKALSKNVLSKVGNAYYFIDDKLGDTLEETIKVLDDKSNSSMKQIIKSKLEV